MRIPFWSEWKRNKMFQAGHYFYVENALEEILKELRRRNNGKD